jgi:hypothetical protein
VNKADVKKQKEYDKAFGKVPPPYRTHEGAGPDRKVEVTSSGATLSLELTQ